jgi:hypothetical protein
LHVAPMHWHRHIKFAIKKTNKQDRLKGDMCAVSTKRKAENRKRYTLKVR